MITAVFDANLLVSAFLSRDKPGGVSNELLRFARQGAFEITIIAPEQFLHLVRAQWRPAAPVTR
jgi:hypothetical protein